MGPKRAENECSHSFSASEGTRSAAVGARSDVSFEGTRSAAVGARSDVSFEGTRSAAVGARSDVSFEGTRSAAVGARSDVSFEGTRSAAVGARSDVSFEGTRSAAVGARRLAGHFRRARVHMALAIGTSPNDAIDSNMILAVAQVTALRDIGYKISFTSCEAYFCICKSSFPLPQRPSFKQPVYLC